jgi:hypothetical protein
VEPEEVGVEGGDGIHDAFVLGGRAQRPCRLGGLAAVEQYFSQGQHGQA